MSGITRQEAERRDRNPVRTHDIKIELTDEEKRRLEQLAQSTKTSSAFLAGAFVRAALLRV